MVVLADLYDADKRTREYVVRYLAENVNIPHPLRNVQYGDGIIPCTHAKRHKPWEFCPMKGAS